MFDLISFLRELTHRRGINPLEYSQTLKEASRHRWGASSILNKNGIEIDLVYQEFSFNYPGMFESLDDFVEALADRLSRKKEKFDPEQIIEYEMNEDELLIDLQVHPTPNYMERELLSDNNLIRVTKGKRKVELTTKAIKRILKVSLENE